MEPVTVAFLYGGLSALSLPLGAAVGLWLSPGLRLTAAVMAFGAGALLCALALGLVVPALGHFPDQPFVAFKWLALGAMLGCLAFIGLDHLLAGMGGYLRKHATLVSQLKRQKQNLESVFGHPTEADMVRAAHSEARGGSNVALAIWLGIALDGIPESLVIGGSMEGTTVSLALIGGLFMANFPESMSSAVIMKKQGGKNLAIIGMWLSLMIMTAVGAAVGNLFIAETPPHIHGMLQGLAAGAMLAMIAQTMLPEAYAHGGWLTGLMTVSGFLAAIGMGLI